METALRSRRSLVHSSVHPSHLYVSNDMYKEARKLSKFICLVLATKIIFFCNFYLIVAFVKLVVKISAICYTDLKILFKSTKWYSSLIYYADYNNCNTYVKTNIPTFMVFEKLIVPILKFPHWRLTNVRHFIKTNYNK